MISDATVLGVSNRPRNAMAVVSVAAGATVARDSAAEARIQLVLRELA
jgi:hypothetical protein